MTWEWTRSPTNHVRREGKKRGGAWTESGGAIRRKGSEELEAEGCSRGQ